MGKNGNHRLCLKSKPHVKCHWSLQAGLTSEGDARTYRFLDLDTAHKLPPPPTPTVQKGPFPDQIGRIAPTETINNPLRTAKAARAASEVKVHVRVEDTVDPPPPPPPPPKTGKGYPQAKKDPSRTAKAAKAASEGQAGGWAINFEHSPQAPLPSSPTVRKGLSPDQKGLIAPTGTINNHFRTAKAVTNDNHRLSKIEVKCHCSLPVGYISQSEAREPSSRLWTQPTSLLPPPSPTRTVWKGLINFDSIFEFWVFFCTFQMDIIVWCKFKI